MVDHQRNRHQRGVAHVNGSEADERFPFGGGENGALIRALDWSNTSLGPISEWPESLKTTVGILLRSPIPIVLLWGPDGIMIYNDAYSIFAGGRHPLLFGSKVREGWPEVADFNDQVMKVGLSGDTLSYRNQELTLHRSGVPEQVWMNLDYSPVLGEDGRPEGVLAIVVETTQQVLAERALAKAEERLRQALNASGMVGTFAWHVQSDTFYSDARFAEMFSVDPAKGDEGAPLSEYYAGIHPEDAQRVADAVNRTVVTREKYVQEYRVLRKDGNIRWVEARGECLYSADGKPDRFVGVVVDVTNQKNAQERQQLLAREADHRVKNIFANFHSMISLSVRSAGSPKEMAHALRGRLDALLRAKDLVRPGIMGTEHESEQTTIDALVRTVLHPYEDGSPDRIVLEGPDVPVGAKAVTGLALVLHETATNAVKYGALSRPDGSIRVTWGTTDNDFRLEWNEIGGPEIDEKPQARGFGSILSERSVTGELGGQIEHDWRRNGLRLKLSIPLERLAV
ncbi:PAS domain-containing protein [Tardiphaga sp. P9-11]|uniref:PAS domain-containing protein n=1 Tax=Tardiphaga sp. P9-11 TaxID=2024614 RepID=UPI0011F2A8EE|nr:PAS domain-containing protein [Tardiphaga sp. P9-11]KAA0078377.1 PAS domain S-box protein [Tardiphaga sp. P9-11]